MRPDTSKHGFRGDADIYGLGIRVGYYTQALSLWIANLWVPHEAPFLHSVNVLFLVAVLVGVSALCGTPRNTYAVEPYMLLQIAYNTAFMGLARLPTPDLLPWEKPMMLRICGDLAMLGLQIFEAWFWWRGLSLLRPTDGPEMTPVFFPWLGQQQLYGWLGIAAKLLNITLILLNVIPLTFVLCFAFMDRKLDREVPMERVWKVAVRKWRAEVRTGSDGSKDADRSKAPSLARSELAMSEKSSLTKPPPSVGGSSTKSSPNHDKSICTSSDLDIVSKSLQALPSSTTFRSNSLGEVLHNNPSKLDTREVQLEAPPHSPILSPSPTLPVETLTSGSPTWLGDDPDLVMSDYALEKNIPSFHDLYTCDQYIPDSLKKPLSYPLSYLCFHFEFAYFLLTLIPLAISRPLRFRTLVSLSQYIQVFPDVNLFTFPRHISHALRSPLHQQVSPYDLYFLVRLKLAADPPPSVTKATMYLWALAMFSNFTVMVIGTELTIVWNYIDGVQSLNAVGQLIPFSLGVGGLVKVAWSGLGSRWGFSNHKDICWGKCNAEKRGEPWVKAGKAYYELKEVYEQQKEGKSVKEEPCQV